MPSRTNSGSLYIVSRITAVGGVGLDHFPGEVDAIEAGHVDVGDQNVRLSLKYELQRLHTID